MVIMNLMKSMCIQHVDECLQWALKWKNIKKIRFFQLK